MSDTPSPPPAERLSALILRLALAVDTRPAGFVRMALMMLIGTRLREIRQSLVRLADLLRAIQIDQPTLSPTNTVSPPTPPRQSPRPKAARSAAPSRGPRPRADRAAPMASPPSPPAAPMANRHRPPETHHAARHPSPAASRGLPTPRTAPAKPAPWHAHFITM